MSSEWCGSGSGIFLITFNNNERLVLRHDIKTIIRDENATNLLVFFNVLFKVKIITVGLVVAYRILKFWFQF